MARTQRYRQHRKKIKHGRHKKTFRKPRPGRHKNKGRKQTRTRRQMREKRGGGGDGIEMTSKNQDNLQEGNREKDNIRNRNSGDFRGWVKIDNDHIGYAVPQKPIKLKPPGKRTYHKIYNDNIQLNENNLLYQDPVLLSRYSMRGWWNGGIQWKPIYKPN